MRGARVKQIRKAHRLVLGEGISKRELKRLLREYHKARSGSQQSQPVTSGYFCARIKRMGKETMGEGDRGSKKQK